MHAIAVRFEIVQARPNLPSFVALHASASEASTVGERNAMETFLVAVQVVLRREALCTRATAYGTLMRLLVTLLVFSE